MQIRQVEAGETISLAMNNSKIIVVLVSEKPDASMDLVINVDSDMVLMLRKHDRSKGNENLPVYTTAIAAGSKNKSVVKTIETAYVLI